VERKSRVHRLITMLTFNQRTTLNNELGNQREVTQFGLSNITKCYRKGEVIS